MWLLCSLEMDERLKCRRVQNCISIYFKEMVWNIVFGYLWKGLLINIVNSKLNCLLYYHFNQFEKTNIIFCCSGIWTRKHQSILKSVYRRKTSNNRQWPSYWICNCWRTNSEIWWFWCDSRISTTCNVPQIETIEEK